MYAKLQAGRQSEFIDGIFYYKDIFFELPAEAGRVTLVIDSLVEAARKLGGYGLHRHFQVARPLRMKTYQEAAAAGQPHPLTPR